MRIGGKLWAIVIFGAILIFINVPQAIAQETYPFETIFKEDLFEIATSIPNIESIYVDHYSGHPPELFWCVIRINYTSGLSDYEKVYLQYNVQYQLEPKWYIRYVEPNYIYWIPEMPPPPWPGFAIGELIVGFWNPTDINHDLKVDMKDIGTAASAFGSYPSHPKWNPYVDITGPEHLVPDSKVDLRDIGLIAKNFGKTYA